MKLHLNTLCTSEPNLFGKISWEIELLKVCLFVGGGRCLFVCFLFVVCFHKHEHFVFHFEIFSVFFSAVFWCLMCCILSRVSTYNSQV